MGLISNSLTIFSEIFHEIYEGFQNNSQLIILSSEYDCLECDLRHFTTESGLSCFIQHPSKKNTDQEKEVCIGTNLMGKTLSVEHTKIQDAQLKIPISKTKRGMRTTSNLRTINIDDYQDYLLIGAFPNFKNNFLKYIFRRIKVDKFKVKDFDKILGNYERKKGYLHLNRRLYLAAPGTSHLAFFLILRLLVLIHGVFII